MVTTATASTPETGDTGLQFNPKHLGSVDALRGLAAIYVACLHTTIMPSPYLTMPDWARPLIMSGSTAVALFFVVSAFTLSNSWFSRNEGSHQVRNFYLRRIFRIVPLFYFLLALTLLRDWFVWHKLHSAASILLNASMLFNLVPGGSTGIVWASWTIGVEILFYLMFPLVIKAASTPFGSRSASSVRSGLAVLFYKGVQHSHLSNLTESRLSPHRSCAARAGIFAWDNRIHNICQQTIQTNPGKVGRGNLSCGCIDVSPCAYL